VCEKHWFSNFLISRTPVTQRVLQMLTENSVPFAHSESYRPVKGPFGTRAQGTLRGLRTTGVEGGEERERERERERETE